METFKNKNIQVKLTDMIYQETKGSLDHSFGDGIIEHSTSSDCLVSHNVNAQNDQIECFEDDIIDDYFELINDWYVFSCGKDDGKFTLEWDVIVNRCQDNSEALSSNMQLDQLGEDLMEEELKGDQMLNCCGRETT